MNDVESRNVEMECMRQGGKKQEGDFFAVLHLHTYVRSKKDSWLEGRERERCQQHTNDDDKDNRRVVRRSFAIVSGFSDEKLYWFWRGR